jgi:hypothetical protein
MASILLPSPAHLRLAEKANQGTQIRVAQSSDVVASDFKHGLNLGSARLSSTNVFRRGVLSGDIQPSVGGWGRSSIGVMRQTAVRATLCRIGTFG